MGVSWVSLAIERHVRRKPVSGRKEIFLAAPGETTPNLDRALRP
jgi:hypothetical protein